MAETKTASKATPKKVYKFRKLKSTDVFCMLKILRAIGVSKFSACFGNESVLKELTNKDANIEVVGMTVIMEMAQVLIDGLGKCEDDVYQLLSDTSNLSIEEIKELDMGVFIEMIIDFIKKDEFTDFIKVVSKLPQSESQSS